MPTAQGNFSRASANRVTAIFIVDDIPTIFNATLEPPIESPFTSISATLTYHDIDSLTSSHSYTGRTGPDKFQLTLDSGTTITGKLHPGGVESGNTVDGTGVWDQA